MKTTERVRGYPAHVEHGQPGWVTVRKSLLDAAMDVVAEAEVIGPQECSERPAGTSRCGACSNCRLTAALEAWERWPNGVAAHETPGSTS